MTKTATKQEIEESRAEIIAKRKGEFWRRFLDLNADFVLDFFYLGRYAPIPQYKTKKAIKAEFDFFCRLQSSDYLVGELLKKGLTLF